MKVRCVDTPMRLGLITIDHRYIINNIYDVVEIPLYGYTFTKFIVDDYGYRLCTLNSAIGNMCFARLDGSSEMISKSRDL